MLPLQPFRSQPHRPSQRRLAWIAAIVLCLGPGWAPGQGSGHGLAQEPHPTAGDDPLAMLSADQIAQRLQQRNEQRAAALQSYESRRVMTLAYKGTVTDKQASEVVQMTYTAPSSKQFVILSAMGSPLLRDSVFQRAMDSEQQAALRDDTKLTSANYQMSLIGTERLPEGPCYVLSVLPRHSSRFLFRGRVWVQGMDFAVVRIDAEPAESPSFWVKNGEFRTEFQKVGDFWFPARTVSTSHVRLGGDATLTIQYGPYHILSARPLRSLAAPEPGAGVSSAPSALGR